MLIEFSVENFRSIRHRQTLSMVAAPRLHKKENTLAPNIVGERRFPSLLKAVAIYGPNASGKTALVRALSVIVIMANRTPTTERVPLPVTPFKFDPELQNQPSKFEVHFVEDGERYTFNLSLTSERIHEERLVSYSKGKPFLLYERRYSESEGHETYNFGAKLEGGESLQNAWKNLTNPQVLFIAQAVANSSEELLQLRKPFNWMSSLMVERYGLSRFAEVTQRLIADLPSIGNDVAQLLSDLDVPVSSITTKIHNEEAKPSTQALESFGDIPAGAKEKLKAVFSSSKVTTTLTHKTSLGEAELDFKEQSDGTKNLFGFALPWFAFNSPEAGVKRKILVIDEIDSSLHPKLVEALVRRHLSGDLACQLIFTTHDTHLMDTKMLRRDQIWLTERDDTGATLLRSIHDFEGRETEDIEKRYYEGRYRGLPVIRRA